jgi:putative transposase
MRRSAIGWNRFGPPRSFSNWRWHLDEVFVKINGELHYLWRAVDHEGEVLEVIATKRRDRKAALILLKRLMKKYGKPHSIVTDRLRSYGAAMKVIGNADRQGCGRWMNNRAENSHQPFRRRECAMLRFRSMKTLQKFCSVHASVQNHFNKESATSSTVKLTSKDARPPRPSGGCSWHRPA